VAISSTASPEALDKVRRLGEMREDEFRQMRKEILGL